MRVIKCRYCGECIEFKENIPWASMKYHLRNNHPEVRGPVWPAPFVEVQLHLEQKAAYAR